jgi:hypothetical protein
VRKNTIIIGTVLWCINVKHMTIVPALKVLMTAVN